MKKLKSVIGLILAFTLLFSAVPFVYSASGSFANSDTECSYDGVYYFLDEDSRVFAGLPGDTQRSYIINFPVDGVAAFEGFIYSYSGNTVYRTDISSRVTEAFISMSAKVADISLYGGELYVLSGGKIVKFTLSGKVMNSVAGSGEITSMWFESAGLLSYMTDGELIYTLDLSSGEISSDVNFSSAFIGDIPVIEHSHSSGSSQDAIGFTSLQAKFPAGYYWNHMGSSTNNPNGVTSRPCNHSANGTSYCNRPYFWDSCQCHGYALQCGYDVVGSNPMNWTKYTSSSAIDSVRAGDVIRLNYTSNQHTIYVLAVDGENVLFTDCNSYGTCNIRWGYSKTKTTLKGQFSYLLKCPVYLSDYYPGGGGTVEYTVKFDLNDLVGKSRAVCSETSRKVKNGEKYGELPVPVREGYDFLGWYSAASGGSKVTENDTVSTNTTLYAQWKIKVYTVSFDANAGGETISNIPASQQKEHFETVRLNITSRTLTRTNYEFNYWNTRPDGSGTQYDKNNYNYSANESATLYAQWKGQLKSVYFYANGGSVSPNYKDVRYSEPYGELPVPVRSGYKFIGWKDSAGNPVDSSTLMTSSNTVSLYAEWGEMTYIVTYNPNCGGTVGNLPAAQIKYYTQNVKISSAVPTRYGYTFSGWNTSPDGSGKPYKADAIYSVNEDLTLYALWTPIESKVSFDSNGGTQTDTVITVRYGSKYGDLPVTSQTGKDFTGWYFTEEGADDKPVTADSTVEIVKDTTLFARWERAKYTVTYAPNNTLVEGMPSDSFRLYGQTGFKLGSEIPKREGFTFIEWNTSADGDGESYQPGQSYDRDASLALYAVWERDRYAVSYNANSGSSAPSGAFKYYDIPLTLSETLPVKTGYDFVGWNTHPDGGGETYLPGVEYTLNEPLTLYAQWDACTYIVRFDPSGGKCSEKSRVYTYNESYELPDAKRVGYSFAGWFTSPQGGKKINESDKIEITSDCTFYARWVAESYTASFDPRGGSVSVSSASFTYDSPFGEMPVPEKTGFTFAGWFADEDFTQQVTAETVMKYARDISLRAAWVQKSVTVSFDPCGGSCDTAFITVTPGEKYGELPVPSRRGFTFGGWYDGSSSEITADTVVSSGSSHTLKAVWLPDSYTVTLMNDGAVYDTVSAVYGSEYPSLGVPSGSGVFCGWYDENGNRVDENSVYSFASDSVLNSRFTSAPASGIIRFVADGVTVGEVPCADSISEPPVPEKQGFESRWEDYDSSSGGIVNAVYTPEVYTVTFKAGDKSVETDFAYGEKIVLPESVAAAGVVITGWSPEIPVSMPAHDLTLTAETEPVTYFAEFISQGRSVGKIPYTVNDTSVSEPDVIEKTGYNGKWQDYSLAPGGITVFSVYTPVTYTAYFKASGKTVAAASFNVETDSLSLPAVPEKDGYTGEWEEYTVVPHDITVNAVYTPNTYYVTFKIAETEEIIAVVPYRYGVKSITEPAVPEREGYSGSWSSYALGATDTVSYAVYKEKEYHITFVSMGKTVAVIPFTVGTAAVVPPQVPVVSGVSGRWEPFSLSARDITVNALYDFPEIEIVRYVEKRTESYKTTITFYSNVTNKTDSGRVHWFINGEDKTPAGSAKYVAEKATSTFTVQAKYIINGETVSESKVETVVIKNGFFDRFIGFFRELFRRLPEVTQ